MHHDVTVTMDLSGADRPPVQLWHNSTDGRRVKDPVAAVAGGDEVALRIGDTLAGGAVRLTGSLDEVEAVVEEAATLLAAARSYARSKVAASDG